MQHVTLLELGEEMLASWNYAEYQRDGFVYNASFRLADAYNYNLIQNSYDSKVQKRKL